MDTKRDLRELQRTVTSELRNSSAPETELAALFHSPATTSVKVRFEAYRRNFLGARHKTLADTFERTRQVVGDSYFRQIARPFARSVRSTSQDLTDFGLDFPEYIRDHILPRDEAAAVPYLADLAAVERAIYCACRRRLPANNSDECPQWLEDMAMISGESRLIIQPEVEIVSSRYAIFTIWKYLEDPTASVINFEQPEAVWIRCVRGNIEVVQLPTKALWIISTIQQGLTLNEIAEKAPAEIALEKLIPELISEGLIIGVEKS